MTYSQKMLVKTMEEGKTGEEALPDINAYSSRPMSGKRRLSNHPSQTSETGKKGPIKAFGDKEFDSTRQQFQGTQPIRASEHFENSKNLQPTPQKNLTASVTLEPLTDSKPQLDIRSSSHRGDSQANILAEGSGVKRQYSQKEESKSKQSERQLPIQQDPDMNLDLDNVTLNDLQNKTISGISQHDNEATEELTAKRRNILKQQMISQNDGKPSLANNTLMIDQQSSKHSKGKDSNSALRASQQVKIPKKPKRVNFFKEKKMTHNQIIDYLLEVGAQNVSLNVDLKPDDLDSTQAIDSFLEAICATFNWTNKKETKKLFETIHLSTGTRTDFCNEILSFLIRQQIKETQFIDAVEFFQEALEHMLKIEKENNNRKEIIENLSEEKQTLTMKSFDLQQKLKETSSALLKLRQKEHDQSIQFQNMKQQFDAKKAECESLHYRLKHLGKAPEQDGQSDLLGGADLQNVIGVDGRSAGQMSSALNEAMTEEPGDKNIETHLSEAQLPVASQKSSSVGRAEPTKVENITEQLLQQVEEFKEHQALQRREEEFEGNCGNFEGVQSMLNQVQITNKSLLKENQTMRTQLESKERLVSHLENKVTQIMLENEETVIKLKSEIITFKNQIEQAEEATRKKLELLKQQTIEDFSEKNSIENTKLKEHNDSLLRQSELQNERITKLTTDYDNLQTEFERFRSEQAAQEKQRDTYVAEIEMKLSNLSKNHVELKSTYGNKIAHLQNQAELKHKENQMFCLRLKYMRQIAEVLLRQKGFLLETLEKSKKELEVKMIHLEATMLSQNKNKPYLVSAEKAVKKSREVEEISKSAMTNIQSIVKFFKIEKIHQLVFQTDEPADLVLDQSTSQKGSRLGLQQTQALSEASVQSAAQRKQEPEESDELGANSEEEMAYNVEKVDGMLNGLKACIDLPVNFKPRILEPTGLKGRRDAQKTVLKDEDHFLNNHQMELISILLKVVVELLTKVGAVESVEQIPHSISRLLYLCNQRSDILTEREIYDLFLFESNKIVIDELRSFNQTVDTHARLKEIMATYGALPLLGTDQQPGTIKETFEQDTKVAKTIVVDSFDKSLSRTPGKLSQEQIVEHQSSEKQSKQASPEKLASEKPKSDAGDTLQRQELQNQLDRLKLKLQTQKERAQEIQRGLAEKVIKLEETIDYRSEDYEERLSAAELAYRQELEQIKIGAQQREKQLLLQIEKFSDRNALLEKAHVHSGADSPPAYGQPFKKQQLQRSTSKFSSNGSINKYIAETRMPTVNEKAKQGTQIGSALASMNTLMGEMDPATSPPALVELQDKCQRLESNLQEFVSVREQTRGTISLVFEAASANLQMINEQMLSFYLAKVFMISKEKFRFLERQEIVEEVERIKAEAALENRATMKRPEPPVEMIKVIVEIIEDQDTIQRDLLRIKTSIRDGSCLLYDLLPAYMTINMGYSGLATRQKLSECHLISKQGREIGGTDFVVSLFRSTTNPYCFFVTLLDLVNGEEYCLELADQDIFQLTEGDQGILDRSEPQDLADLIIENLELIERDGIKFLTCEHRIFFNSLWQEFMSSTVSAANQVTPQEPVQQAHDLRLKETLVSGTPFSASTFRDHQINTGSYPNKFDNSRHYTGLLKTEISTQTDFEGSVFYDSQVTVYQGFQRLNEDVKIDMTVYQSMNENLLTLHFEETKNFNSVKFSVFNKLPQTGLLSSSGAGTESYHEENDSGSRDFEQRVSVLGGGKQPKGQYLMHSECIQIKQEHLVLVCVERIQNDGLLVKLHDLKLMTSDEFFLVRKSNGHLTRLNTNQHLALTYKEDFRNMVFELSFTQQAQSQDVVLNNMAYAADKMQALGKNPSKVSQELFSQTQKASEVATVRKIQGFSAEAFVKTPDTVVQANQIDDWKITQERGLLLYRDCIVVRCSFETDEEMYDETEQQSLISLYLKDQLVNIEVYLFNDAQKMSITSNVTSFELFGREPLDIAFYERITLLRTMLEKLFILQEDNRFHMKVEGEAEPISQVLERREKQQSQASLAEVGTQTHKRKGISEAHYEDRVRDFQLEKEGLVQAGKARRFKRWVAPNGLDYNVHIYVTIKSRKPTIKAQHRKLNTVGKTMQQIEQQKCEMFMDENAEFDQIYVETQTSDDLLYTLLEKRSLARILTKDVTCKWQQLITTWGRDLMDYLFKNIDIDTVNKKLDFYNQEDVSELLVTHCRTMAGGQILKRENDLIVDGFGEESNQLLKKTLVLNQEVDFTEFSYDIKLWKVSRKSQYGDGSLDVANETLAYHLEVFYINAPDIIYKHRIPVSHSKENEIHDPMTFTIDLINLIDHPLKEIEAKEKKEKEDQLRQQNTRQNLSNAPQKQMTVKLKKRDANMSPDSENQKTSERGISSGPGQSQEGAGEDSPKRDATPGQVGESQNQAKEQSIKYQKLFKKYIDNQLLLTIQESKFPAAISFALIEPTSRLQWKCTYEPNTEIVSPSYFSVVDPGSIENFLTLVYDQTSQESIVTTTEKTKEIKTSGSWYQMADKENQTYLVDHDISENLKIKMSKERGKLRVQLQDPSTLEDEERNYSSSNLAKQQSSLTKPGVYQASDREIGSDNQIYLEPMQGLDIRFQRTRGVYMMGKVLNIDDASYESSVDRSFVLLVNVAIAKFTVTLVSLKNFEKLFEFEFTHVNPAEYDIYITPATEVNAIYSVSDVKPFAVEAIKHLNSLYVQEQVVCNHLRLLKEMEKTSPYSIGQIQEGVVYDAAQLEESRMYTFENVLNNLRKCVQSESRFYQRNLKTEKVVTLHRKIFYDEHMQKLIIITANISYTQGMQRLDNPMLLKEDVNEFQFRILEPEQNILTLLDVPFETCFNERQLASLNRKDMMRLKNLARIILEERAMINRKEMQENDQYQAYTLDISPQEQHEFDGMDDGPMDDMNGEGQEATDIGGQQRSYREANSQEQYPSARSGREQQNGADMGNGMEEVNVQEQVQQTQLQGQHPNSIIEEENEEMDMESSQQPNNQLNARSESRKLTTGQGSRSQMAPPKDRLAGNSSQRNLAGSSSLMEVVQEQNKGGVSAHELPKTPPSEGGLNKPSRDDK